MVSSRAVRLTLVSVALFGAASLSATAAPAPVSAIARRVYFRPETPLTDIPLYSLPASSPEAMRSLEAEIERLYQHLTTLESGPDSRALRSRIFGFEKQFSALSPKFDAVAWEALRAAVKAEWLGVQATLPPAATASVGRVKPAASAEASAPAPAPATGSRKA